jgi:hypothetical protein
VEKMFKAETEVPSLGLFPSLSDAYEIYFIHMYACDNLRKAKWIFIKFDIREFYKKLSSPFNFG